MDFNLYFLIYVQISSEPIKNSSLNLGVIRKFQTIVLKIQHFLISLMIRFYLFVMWTIALDAIFRVKLKYSFFLLFYHVYYNFITIIINTYVFLFLSMRILIDYLFFILFWSY